MLPERIGKYLIKDLLGQGTMGIVYLGLDPLLDRLAAIKVIANSLMVNEEVRNRFLGKRSVS